MTIKILAGDCLKILKTLPDESVNCCVTSPPYWGLRDYLVDGQIGLEETVHEYVEKMAVVFREVRRVLQNDGTLWLNLGDSYCGNGKSGRQNLEELGKSLGTGGGKKHSAMACGRASTPKGLKPKDLIGVPWRVAFALQDDGWYLRSEIIWHKQNPMPESVTDRPTKAHEQIFLLSKSPKYYYDCDAIREPYGEDERISGLQRARLYGYDGKGTYADWYNKERQGKDWVDKKSSGDQLTYGQAKKASKTAPPNLPHPDGKNKRDVWAVASEAFKEAHFATFPTKLIEPCILAGCPEKGTVIDPFFGAGTTGLVADRLGRDCIGIELNPKYIEIAEERLNNDAGMFAKIQT